MRVEEEATRDLRALSGWLCRYATPEQAAGDLGLIIEQDELAEAGPVLSVGRLIRVQSGTADEVSARAWSGVAHRAAEDFGITDRCIIQLAACAAWSAQAAAGQSGQSALTAG